MPHPARGEIWDVDLSPLLLFHDDRTPQRGRPGPLVFRKSGWCANGEAQCQAAELSHAR